MLRRNYITDAQGTGFTSDQIALAEMLIDQYVGWQDKFLQSETFGRVSSHSNKTIFDTNSNTALNVNDNYYLRGVVEILGGTGIGGIRNITSSSQANKSLTYEGDALTLDTTSIFKIYQLAKFPRNTDTYATPDTATFYKSIPQAVQEAVIAQCAFIEEMGDEFFISDDTEMTSETLGKYSYSRGSSSAQSSTVKMISPKVRSLLRGIKNSGGRLVADNPTCL